MTNLTVEELINQTLGLIVPTVVICIKGSGRVYSGPIMSIPQQFKNKTYVMANIYPSSGELIITVKEDYSNE